MGGGSSLFGHGGRHRLGSKQLCCPQHDSINSGDSQLKRVPTPLRLRSKETSRKRKELTTSNQHIRVSKASSLLVLLVRSRKSQWLAVAMPSRALHAEPMRCIAASGRSLKLDQSDLFYQVPLLLGPDGRDGPVKDCSKHGKEPVKGIQMTSLKDSGGTKGQKGYLVSTGGLLGKCCKQGRNLDEHITHLVHTKNTHANSKCAQRRFFFFFFY